MQTSKTVKIRVSRPTRAALLDKGRMDETYDDVVRRLLRLWDLVGLELPKDVATSLYAHAEEVT